MGPLRKAYQRTALSAVTSRTGFCIVTAALSAVLVAMLAGSAILLGRIARRWPAGGNVDGDVAAGAAAGKAGAWCVTGDNLGGVAMPQVLCHDAIDAVYTWVNGSDLAWYRTMMRYKRAWFGIVPGTRRDAALDDAVGASAVAGGDANCTRLPPAVSAELLARWLAVNGSVGAGDALSVRWRDAADGPAGGGNVTSAVCFTGWLCLASNGSEWLEYAVQAGSLGGLGDDGLEDLSGMNRYRDNDELRYSFRSLFKYAPWLRRVWLVTNGQVPSWLNLSHPRITVVTHADIFPDPSHLPVFSSPAIEVHLHRIPGISRRFIYFNDDVMLGAPITPDDFVTQAKGQKMYLSWEVPKCATGCMDNWLGDGYCDAACNTTRCFYDGGDCIGNVTKTRGSGSTSHHRGSGRYDAAAGTSTANSGSTSGVAAASETAWLHSPPGSLGLLGGAHLLAPDVQCASGCPDNWLGDKVCDLKCNTAECGFDGGDCGVERVAAAFASGVAHLPSAFVRASGEWKADGIGDRWQAQLCSPFSLWLSEQRPSPSPLPSPLPFPSMSLLPSSTPPSASLAATRGPGGPITATVTPSLRGDAPTATSTSTPMAWSAASACALNGALGSLAPLTAYRRHSVVAAVSGARELVVDGTGWPTTAEPLLLPLAPWSAAINVSQPGDWRCLAFLAAHAQGIGNGTCGRSYWAWGWLSATTTLPVEQRLAPLRWRAPPTTAPSLNATPTAATATMPTIPPAIPLSTPSASKPVVVRGSTQPRRGATTQPKASSTPHSSAGKRGQRDRGPSPPARARHRRLSSLRGAHQGAVANDTGPAAPCEAGCSDQVRGMSGPSRAMLWGVSAWPTAAAYNAGDDRTIVSSGGQQPSSLPLSLHLAPLLREAGEAALAAVHVRWWWWNATARCAGSVDERADAAAAMQAGALACSVAGGDAQSPHPLLAGISTAVGGIAVVWHDPPTVGGALGSVAFARGLQPSSDSTVNASLRVTIQSADVELADDAPPSLVRAALLHAYADEMVVLLRSSAAFALAVDSAGGQPFAASHDYTRSCSCGAVVCSRPSWCAAVDRALGEAADGSVAACTGGVGGGNATACTTLELPVQAGNASSALLLPLLPSAAIMNGTALAAKILAAMPPTALTTLTLRMVVRSEVTRVCNASAFGTSDSAWPAHSPIEAALRDGCRGNDSVAVPPTASVSLDTTVAVPVVLEIPMGLVDVPIAVAAPSQDAPGGAPACACDGSADTSNSSLRADAASPIATPDAGSGMQHGTLPSAQHIAGTARPNVTAVPASEPRWPSVQPPSQPSRLGLLQPESAVLSQPGLRPSSQPSLPLQPASSPSQPSQPLQPESPSSQPSQPESPSLMQPQSPSQPSLPLQPESPSQLSPSQPSQLSQLSPQQPSQLSVLPSPPALPSTLLAPRASNVAAAAPRRLSAPGQARAATSVRMLHGVSSAEDAPTMADTVDGGAAAWARHAAELQAAAVLAEVGDAFHAGERASSRHPSRRLTASSSSSGHHERWGLAIVAAWRTWRDAALRAAGGEPTSDDRADDSAAPPAAAPRRLQAPSHLVNASAQLADGELLRRVAAAGIPLVARPAAVAGQSREGKAQSEPPDTYADSLIASNRLINTAFTRRSRKVPAHMPHMIDVAAMIRLQQRFPAEFAATSQRRFRSSLDLQYAFTYFHFLVEGGARRGLDAEAYWAAELDADGDGLLSDNEFRTLVAVVYRKAPTAADIASLRDCVAGANETIVTTTATNAERDTIVTTTTTVRWPAVTLRRVLACEDAREGLAKNARSEPTHEDMGLDEVSFEMVTDDYNKTLAQLDGVRYRKTKFICINDDMAVAPPATRQALRDFFEANYARPSAFELPPRMANGPEWLPPLHERQAMGAAAAAANETAAAGAGAGWNASSGGGGRVRGHLEAAAGAWEALDPDVRLWAAVVVASATFGVIVGVAAVVLASWWRAMRWRCQAVA